MGWNDALYVDPREDVEGKNMEGREDQHQGRKARKGRKKKNRRMRTEEEKRMDKLVKLKAVVEQLKAHGIERFAGEQIARRAEQGRSPWNKVVVYGLGHVGTSDVALHQLALALLFHDILRKAHPNTWDELLCYDPAFDESDRRLLQQAECRVMERPDEFEGYESEPILYYMPHCEGPVYDMVLRQRWNLLALEDTAILGNSFRTYHDVWNGTGCKPTHASKPTEVLRIAPYTTEIEIPDPNHLVVGAFNNTSLMTFPILCLEPAKAELGLS